MTNYLLSEIFFIMSNGRKKVIQYTSSLLTFGASLSLGLLSFGGMWIFWPVFSLSLATFALSVIYEGEIYHKNIFRALLKLNNPQFIEQKIAEEFLEYLTQHHDTLTQELISLKQKLKEFKENSKPENEIYEINEKIKQINKELETYDIATYFPDYTHVLSQLSLSDSEDLHERRQKMEIFIGEELLSFREKKNNKLSIQLKECFNLHQINPDELHKKVESKRKLHLNIQIFSMTAALLMSIGSIYLLLETLEILTLITISAQLLPFIIIPLSVLVGISYGFLTYNSLTDFLLNETLNKWLQEIYNEMKSGDVFKDNKKLSFIIVSLFVLILNLTLTLCTAGTWWTLVNQNFNTWKWLASAPMKIVVNMISIVIALATLCFNLENTIETINEIRSNKANNEHKHKIIPETTWQQLNPFRALLKITYVPLRIILFLGHLLSISLTSDRMPGVPAFVSISLGFLSEGLEDGHYFLDFKNLFSVIPEETECTHNPQAHIHSDLPKNILQTLFIGLFYPAAYWHYVFQDHPKTKSFQACLDFYFGKKENKINDNEALLSLSPDWLKQEVKMNCEVELNRLNGCVINPVLIEEKKRAIELLKNSENIDDIRIIRQKNPRLGTHRLFQSNEETSTNQCINQSEKKLYIASIHNKFIQKKQSFTPQELQELLDVTTAKNLNDMIDLYNPIKELNFASRTKTRTESLVEYLKRNLKSNLDLVNRA